MIHAKVMMMEISKSKRQLAQLLIDAGVKQFQDGANWAAQDKSHGARSKNIGFYRRLPVKPDAGGASWSTNKHDCNGIVGGWIEPDVLILNWHQTALSCDEFNQIVAETAPDADGWIEWKGGECPVEVGALIDVKYRDLHVQLGSKVGDRSAVEMYATTHWRNSGGAADIIAYRLHKLEQSKPEFCESVMRSIPEPIAKPTIEQLAADYHNAKDYAERKQQEADDAKADVGAKLKALNLAGKEHGLLVSPVTAKQEPELVITDWRQWRVGDVVSWSLLNHAGEFEIISVHHDPSRNIGDFEVEDKQGGVYRVYGNECRFIRRP